MVSSCPFDEPGKNRNGIRGDAVNKFDIIDDPAGMPTRVNALPELQFPARFNITRALFERIENAGWEERSAFLSDNRRVSYGELIQETRGYAAALAARGVGPGDRVVLRIADSPELAIAILAVQALGGIVVATFTQLRSEDLLYRVRDTGARFAIVAADLIEEMLPVVDAESALKILVLGDEPSGRFEEILEPFRGGAPPIDFADTAPDDIAVIAYTSGTTGRPKGAAHSHRDVLAATETYFRHCVRPREDDVIAGPPSIPFTLGMAFLIYFPLWFGAAAVVGADKSPEACVDAVRRHSATILVAVPTYYNQLLRHLQATETKLPTLRQTLIGGEPLYPELEAAWRDETGLPLVQFIGTTEMFHCIISYRHGIDEPRTGCLGRAVPGYEVTVRDPETFDEVANGEHGLMCVRGPTSCVYWSPREIQADAVRDGWNIVQDTVWKDDEGYIYFVSRRDEMIVSGGFNIAPADVERVLIRHPAVAECACAPAPDETGERAAVVKAFIVLNDGFEPGPDLGSEIQTYFKDNGPPFMYPRKIEFIDALPKGITGKVQRSELRRREMGR